jgi:hypothetical protein
VKGEWEQVWRQVTVVCFKALSRNFHGLMQIPSRYGRMPDRYANSAFLCTKDCQPLGRDGVSFRFASPIKDKFFQLYFIIFHMTVYL